MADLFQTSRTNVVEDIKHSYAEGELDEVSTYRKFRQVWMEGNREVSREIPLYMSDYVEQLDFVLSSGNRKLLTGSGKVSYDQAMKTATKL